MNFKKFNTQLRERYGFNINKEEYERLCFKPDLLHCLKIENMKEDTQAYFVMKIEDTAITGVYSFNERAFTSVI